MWAEHLKRQTLFTHSRLEERIFYRYPAQEWREESKELECKAESQMAGWSPDTDYRLVHSVKKAGGHSITGN